MHSIYIQFTITLLAILNPIGNIAIFLALCNDFTKKEQRKTAINCSIAIVIILLLSLWLGTSLLQFFGISIGAFAIAGGFIVATIGLSMLHGAPNKAHNDAKQQVHESVAVTPLAIPIIAGPGAITTVIAHAYMFTDLADKGIESAICIILGLFIGMILFFSPMLGKLVEYCQ